VLQTVRHMGPDGPPHGPGRSTTWARTVLRIVVDELIHLRNDQLGKLVSP
jgi:hypothetical protein